MQDLNEQLEETHNQTENEMREELDMKENKVREVRYLLYRFNLMCACMVAAWRVFVSCCVSLPVITRQSCNNHLYGQPYMFWGL